MPSAAGSQGDEGSRRAAARVAVVTGLVTLALIGLLATARGGAGWFVKFGSESANTGFGREVLGPDVPVPFDESQDGVQFWLLARDPFLRDAPALEASLDRPAYRAQRIAYPWLAAPWRLGGEQALVWGLVLVNAGALAVGAWFTARLAQLLGGRAEIGYVFALNPASVVSLMLDLSEIVALAGLAAAVYLVRRSNWSTGSAAGAVAVLAKEAALLVLAAVALGARGVPWSRRVALVGLAAVPAAAWWFYVRSRFGGQPWGSQEFTPVPFGGYVEAWDLAWRPARHWGDLAVAVLAVVSAAAVIVRFVRTRTLELWAALPFAVLVPFLSFQVVNRNINLVRAIGPVLLFLLVDVLASRAARRASTPEATALAT